MQTGQMGEVNVTLNIAQVFERHYDMKFILSAENSIGKNSTTITLVEEGEQPVTSCRCFFVQSGGYNFAGNRILPVVANFFWNNRTTSK